MRTNKILEEEKIVSNVVRVLSLFKREDSLQVRVTNVENAIDKINNIIDLLFSEKLDPDVRGVATVWYKRGLSSLLLRPKEEKILVMGYLDFYGEINKDRLLDAIHKLIEELFLRITPIVLPMIIVRTDDPRLNIAVANSLKHIFKKELVRKEYKDAISMLQTEVVYMFAPPGKSKGNNVAERVVIGFLVDMGEVEEKDGSSMVEIKASKELVRELATQLI